jgi:hypothetical protein
MRSLAVLVTALAVGCSSPTEPTVRRAAWLGHTPEIIAPDTVRAGVPFQATVVAFIGATGYCSEPDGASVSREPALARVELFVRENRGEWCPGDVIFRHPLRVDLQFDRPGTGQIRVVGESLVSLSGAALVRDSVQRIVVVIP